jgi:hypothetical protein
VNLGRGMSIVADSRAERMDDRTNPTFSKFDAISIGTCGPTI